MRHEGGCCAARNAPPGAGAGRWRGGNRRDSRRVMGVGWVLAATLAGAQIAPAPTSTPTGGLNAPQAPNVAPQVGETAQEAVPEQGPPSAPGKVRAEPLTLEQLVQRARKQDARVEEARAEL